MRLSIVAAALASVVVVSAANISVLVGSNGTLTYQPSSVNASVGDTIAFTFTGGNHTVTQSSFATPCTALSGGITSGFVPANSSNTTLAQWSFTMTNASAPLWFYCQQTGHCQKGMVFAVNPTAAKSFAAFQAAAESSNSTTNSTSTGTGTTAAPKATTSSGAMKMRSDGSMGVSLAFVGMVMGLVL
jgi:plastocyanin